MFIVIYLIDTCWVPTMCQVLCLSSGVGIFCENWVLGSALKTKIIFPESNLPSEKNHLWQYNPISPSFISDWAPRWSYCLVANSCQTLATPWTVSHQVPPFPLPGHLPDPEIDPTSPALASRFFTTELLEKPDEVNLPVMAMLYEIKSH